MKARIPRQYESLSDHDKLVISKVVDDLAYEKFEKYEADIQKIFLKLACINLNNHFGFGESRLMIFLAGFERLYMDIDKLKTNEEVEKYLDKRIKEIFKKGYPQDWVDRM